MKFRFGQSKLDPRTMWRAANKRKRTGCILLVAVSLVLWFLFRDDGRLTALTRSASFYVTRNATRLFQTDSADAKRSLEDLLKKTEITIERRVENMQNLCQKNFSNYNGYLNPKAFKEHSIYNERYKFIMCLAEKTGCSFFKRVLYYYSGHKKISNPFILTLGAAHSVPQNTTNKLLDEELADMMPDYFKFLFVRDPFKRLFSGYVDKIFSRYDYWSAFSSGIIRQFRNVTDKHLICGLDATFPEFIKYIIHRMGRREGINGHFLPIYQHCNPCSSNFNFIGKLEHFYSDATYLFHKLNLGHLDIVKKAKAVSVDDEFVDAASIIYGDRDNKNLRRNKCFNWYNFTRRTWRKLQVKGLISTKIPLPLTKQDMTLMTMPQFLTLMKAAHIDSHTDPEFHDSKRYSFLEAYYSVPKADLEKLADLMLPESEIWGYPPRPSELFDYNNRVPLRDFQFFNFDDV